MAKQLVALLLICLIALSLFAAPAMAKKKKSGGGPGRPGSVPQSQCSKQCTRRCSKTQYHKPCIFFCNKCCNKCLCVPPGFYGNKQVCPCYNNWKTKEGGPKCP